MTQAGRALVLERYEDLMNSSVPLPGGERTLLRRVVLLQTQAMARVMRGEQERYRGYTP